MNKLIIDCSNGLKVIAQSENNSYEYFDEDAKKQSDSLLEKIDIALEKVDLKISDIDVIAVGIGPGSFTGIRVAIATAKGLAIGSDAKVVAFNSFDAFSADITDRNYGIIVEGFGNNYYYFFKKFGKIFQGCTTSDKLVVLANGIKVVGSNDKVCKSITDFNVEKASYNAVLCVNKLIEKNMFVQTNQITPLYLRASQAELERMKNGN